MPALLNLPCSSVPCVEVEIDDGPRSFRTVYLTARELRRYDKDPDGFAAKLLGCKTVAAGA